MNVTYKGKEVQVLHLQPFFSDLSIPFPHKYMNNRSCNYKQKNSVLKIKYVSKVYNPFVFLRNKKAPEQQLIQSS